MTVANANLSRTAMLFLWKRAPLWRLALIVALLFTLLFFAFPPETHVIPAPNIPAQASYVPPPVAHNELKQHTTVTSPPKPFVPTAAPTPKPIPLQPSSSAMVLPKTASLSLAVPENTSPKESETGLDAALLGRTYSSSIQVNGFKLPLPEGNWVMLASQGINFPASSGTDYFLGRIKNKRLIGAMIVYALRVKSPSDTVQGSLTQSSGCSRTNTIYMSGGDAAADDLPSCWYMYNYFTPELQQWSDRAVKMNSLTRAAAGDLTAKGVTFPQDFIAVQFVRSGQGSLLYANYLFSPESEGITSDTAPTFVDSDWFFKNISRYPEKVAYAEKIKAWATSFWPQYQAAFAAGQ